MNYPNKPHSKIFASVLLGCLQYFLLTSEFITSRNDQGQIASFFILTANALLLSITLGSTALDVKNQLCQEIKEDIKYIKNEIIAVETNVNKTITKVEKNIYSQAEKFEHVVLDDATLLLGAKVYRPNPILGKFD